MKRKIYIENMPLEKTTALFEQRLEEADCYHIKAEEITVSNSLGRITASPVYARRSSPHYISSAMDGIAVKASSTAGATEVNPVTLKADDFFEVDTGDYIPAQFDAVIMIEEVNFINETAQIIKAAVPWQHIRSVGEDIVTYDMLIPSFTRIGPYEVASLITAGVNTLNAIKKPIVGIIPTGTELVDRGSEEMAPGLIVESNSHMLKALCEEWGAVALRHEIVIDDREQIRRAIEEMTPQADIIIVCSGSSAGREDYTASLLEEMGELIVHGLAVRPGKPAILGLIEQKPFIGVPGYPVSADLIFGLFAKPLIYKMQGLLPPPMPELECNAARKMPSPMGVDDFINVSIVKIAERYHCFPLVKGAGITTSLVKSDGVLCIKRGMEGLQAGDNCIVTLRQPLNVIDESIITIGSHDLSIDILADILQKRYGLRLISINAGSMGGIFSLRRKETHFAGLHLLDYETGGYNVSYVQKYLSGDNWLLINLVKRDQGLIIQKNNPLNISSLKDLKNPQIRYINRQNGSGTRILLDYLLEKEDIKPQEINGYNREEYTHLAVAASIKNGASDTGLGIYSSARALNLDFIPITREQYDLCILPQLFSTVNLERLYTAILSDEFKDRIMAIGGYNLDSTGQIITSNNI
ncbi:MAG TPA: molybdopterin biosynthesis protein [Syntrophomonadaceae bacterium]|nr:molybdopterin biosynthesis protein [Syntrophomonadaceae bacterium]